MLEWAMHSAVRVTFEVRSWNMYSYRVECCLWLQSQAICNIFLQQKDVLHLNLSFVIRYCSLSAIDWQASEPMASKIVYKSKINCYNHVVSNVVKR
jgi:hypothetical protein